jgi:hypothetical protein
VRDVILWSKLSVILFVAVCLAVLIGRWERAARVPIVRQMRRDRAAERAARHRGRRLYIDPPREGGVYAWVDRHDGC